MAACTAFSVVNPAASLYHTCGSPGHETQSSLTSSAVVSSSASSLSVSYVLPLHAVGRRPYDVVPERKHSLAFLRSSLGGDGFWPARQRRSGRRHVRAVPCSAKANKGREPLKIMISGAPASGKGTQSELILEKYGLTHIAAGDLLRAEVAAGTEWGKKAQEYMQRGKLVPDEVVVTMVKNRLFEPIAQNGGWLLDGYPRSLSQAQALEALNIRPQLFILLDVPHDILVQRVAGRRHDAETGKIYHLMYSPPESPEIAARLTQRLDDTEEKVKLRLKTHQANVDAVLDVYKDIIKRVDGNRPKDVVFAEIEKLISEFQEEQLEETVTNGSPISHEAAKESWRGIPTKLNTCPHTREIRQYFYKDVCEATKRAVEDGLDKLKVQITIPELNPEMDVYRIGTLLELVRELAFTFANDGKRVRVCVQGAMGEGMSAGMPLQLAGTRRLLELMDWGSYGAKGTFVNIGAVGPLEVQEEDDMFILMAPQNAVGNCIIEDLQAMVVAAGKRPVIVVNPKLKDVPGAGGVMQIMGRDKRMEFAGSFFTCYNFRLLYMSGTMYPILGALRMTYPAPYEVYKRLDLGSGREEYTVIGSFDHEPNSSEIGDAFYGRLKKKEATPTGIWGFFAGLLN